MTVDINFDVILNGSIREGKIVGIPNVGIASILETLKNKGYQINVFTWFAHEHANYRKLVEWFIKNSIIKFIQGFSIRAGIEEDHLVIDNRSIDWDGIPTLYNMVKALKAVPDEK